MKKFSKKKMVERLIKEGRGSQITDDIIEIMDDIDGQEVQENCWDRQVYGQPVFYVVGKSGEGRYVNEADCI